MYPCVNRLLGYSEISHRFQSNFWPQRSQNSINSLSIVIWHRGQTGKWPIRPSFRAVQTVIGKRYRSCAQIPPTGFSRILCFSCVHDIANTLREVSFAFHREAVRNLPEILCLKHTTILNHTLSPYRLNLDYYTIYVWICGKVTYFWEVNNRSF